MLTLCQSLQRSNKKRNVATTSAENDEPAKKRTKMPRGLPNIETNSVDEVPDSPEPSGRAQKGITCQKFYEDEHNNLNVSVQNLSMVDSSLEEIEQ